MNMNIITENENTMDYIRANLSNLWRRYAIRNYEEYEDFLGGYMVWLCQRIKTFDPSRASLNTFLHYNMNSYATRTVYNANLQKNQSYSRAHEISLNLTEKEEGVDEDAKMYLSDDFDWTKIDLREDLQKHINKLEGFQKESLEMFMLGYTQKEIGEHFGKSKQWFRECVLKKLKKSIGSY